MTKKWFLCLLCAALPVAAAAAPKAELWARWEAHAPDSAATVDHALWDEFLQTHLREKDGIHLVAYGAVSAAARQALRDYLALLAATPVDSLNRDEQLAFWINLYNALTIEVILDDYPVDSIRDIGGSLFSPGPWQDKRFTVAGEELSLNDIEHRILRPIWGDARIHYAVNCASIGCPNLAMEAYRADNAEQLLERGAKAYVNHPRGARVENGKLTVSSIYVWFQEDFGGNAAGVIAHLKKYADPPLRAMLDAVSDIDDDAYDWSLNRP